MSGFHYLPLTEQERREMLAFIGADTVEDLFRDIPEELRLKKELDLPPALSEREAFRHLKGLADKNANFQDCASFLGGGVYDHFIPSIVKHVTGRSEFYTSYTPYQAEISQGLLQAIFEYQTYITQLTGMEISNASLYDGATAVTEAALMACGITKRSSVLVSKAVNPFYRQVLQRYFDTRGLALEEVALTGGFTDLEKVDELSGDDTAALIMQTPNFFGLLEEPEKAAPLMHPKGSLFIAVVDPISLALLPAPGEYGADIAVGEGQPLGSPASFGGPLLGFLAARQKFLRSMPGRLVGETVDTEGNRGYVMTLQTREQHVRRERATSNICTNEALNALAAAVYLSALGPQGLKEAAASCMQKAAYARQKIAGLPGFEIPFEGTFFKEFPVRLPGKAKDLNEKLLQKKILGGLDIGPYYPELENTVLFCVTENRTRAEIDALVEGLEGWK